MANSVSFLAYSSSTPFTNKSPNSKINCEIYPLASKIIVKNLPFSASESRLLKEFSKFGQIAEVKIIKDEARQKSKGFAFIQYTSQEAALLALESMDYQLFDERQLFVELAKPRKSDFGGYPRTSGPPQEQSLATLDDVDE
ncbi:small RNA-binding protein 11, chloroplastic [Salvia miltiorrhiza]|uniref:small RNA-binding protein 11, chloroplastic n=1 Tax=Salvia miltiorrhiza TaxID=226208 RepID=UPI0025ABDEEA|nr:small RNA-binding protein 11, chloroplastic [Salvia miltiorrhiza]